MKLSQELNESYVCEGNLLRLQLRVVESYPGRYSPSPAKRELASANKALGRQADRMEKIVVKLAKHYNISEQDWQIALEGQG